MACFIWHDYGKWFLVQGEKATVQMKRCKICGYCMIHYL